MDYTIRMVEIRQSDTFALWLHKLKDKVAVARVNARLRRLSETGHFGDAKPLRDGVSECVSIMARDTGFITCSAVRSS